MVQLGYSILIQLPIESWSEGAADNKLVLEHDWAFKSKLTLLIFHFFKNLSAFIDTANTGGNE